MRRILGAIAAAGALAVAAVLATSAPAAAVNGPECGEDGVWFGYAGDDGIRIDPAPVLPPSLDPWRDLITCAFELPVTAAPPFDPAVLEGDDIPRYIKLVLRDFPVDEVPALFRAFTTGPGWPEPPDVYVHDASFETDARYIPVEEFTAVPVTDGYVEQKHDRGVPPRYYLRFDTGASITRDFPEPTLVVEWWGEPAAGAAGTGFDDPSTFSTLRTIAEAAPTPTQTAVIAGSAVVLMLVVGWPALLLDTVIGARYESARGWVRERREARKRRADAEAAAALAADSGELARPRRSRGWLIWPGFATAALISGFVDPAFGFNAMSLRMLLSAFLGFVVFNIGLGALTKAVIARVEPRSAPRIEFAWASLGLVLLAVLLARLLQFHPGLVFGLVAGLAYAVALTKARSAMVTLVGVGFALAAGAIAWVGYSLLVPLTATTPAWLTITEFLSALTLQAVSTLPLALLPLAALEGQKLFRWNRWVWGGTYAVGLGAFLFVLVAVPESFAEVPGDYVRWVLLFGGFAIGAVGLWWLNEWFERRKGRRASEAANPLDQPVPPQPA